MWNRIRQWWKAEGDWAQLQSNSDRMLADMGLEREGLRERVMGHEVETSAPCGCLPAANLARS
jgi:putative lipase involved disintegration of autophagic bodies